MNNMEEPLVRNIADIALWVSVEKKRLLLQKD